MLEQDKQLLQQSEERYRALDDLTDNIMFEIDLRSRGINFNHNYRRIFGQDPYITDMDQLTESHSFVTEEDLDAYQQFCQSILNGEREFATDLRILGAEGEAIWYHIEYTTLLDRCNKPFLIVGKLTNINEQKKELTRLQYQVQTDSLTKLYNHEAVICHINDFLRGEGANGNHALLLADIDDFKHINDNFGHQSGDEALLKYVAHMRRLFRSTDIIGRLGGDEFIILLKNANKDKFVISKAQDLCAVQPFTIVDRQIIHPVTCSVGIAVFPRDGDCFKALYRKADTALYMAKAQGKNRFCFYSEPDEFV